MNKQLTVNRLKRVAPEDIRLRKLELLDEINLQKDVIVYSAKKMLNPFAGTETAVGSNRMMKKFSTGMVLVDGIMMGYKVFKGIKRLFRR